MLAAAGSATAAGVYWTIAAGAARRRRIALGAAPALLLPLAAGSAAVAAIAGAHAAAVAACAGLAVAAWVDARTGYIFDPLTLAVGLTSLALCAPEGAALNGIGGAAAVGAALLLLHALTGGRGLGLGDVKLGAATGMALGVAAGLTALAFAFIFGGAYGIWLLASKRATARTAIGFAPFIAVGALTALALPPGVQL